MGWPIYSLIQTFIAHRREELSSPQRAHFTSSNSLLSTNGRVRARASRVSTVKLMPCATKILVAFQNLKDYKFDLGTFLQKNPIFR